VFRLLLFFLAAAVSGQEFEAPCEAAPELLRRLETLPPLQDYSVPYETRIGPLRKLAEDDPDDFFVQRYYQDGFRRRFHVAGEYDHALALYRKHPSGTLSKYLEARLLMMAKPREAKAAFNELLSRYPRFVWPHLDFLEWTELPGRRDPGEAETHIKAFLEGCPEAIEGYDHLSLARDPSLLRRTAEGMRRVLERRKTVLDLARWPQLWSLESRASTDTKLVQERIRSDLKRIESALLEPGRPYLHVYRQASELLHDPAILEAFQARVAREAPQSHLMLSLLQLR
jgi:hypothetical protein